ncbi:hypothetical protein H3S85_00975 [Bartonella sp. M0187]|uniref:hypothetical protein n=1 Tax=Bartonella apihabitans TaxID=2750929 RepID=UPI0018DD4777|nr:hypothetical protein [Bartonella apihabitans]MBI0025036.1 hypothetical protein [Bartonella apihabitans]
MELSGQLNQPLLLVDMKNKTSTHKKIIFLQLGGNVLEKADIERVKTLATGYSCRPQVDRFKKIKLRHPIQVLLNELF